MDLERLREIEMIDPTPLPPWRAEAFSKIEIEPEQGDRHRTSRGGTLRLGHCRLLRRLGTPRPPGRSSDDTQ